MCENGNRIEILVSTMVASNGDKCTERQRERLIRFLVVYFKPSFLPSRYLWLLVHWQWWCLAIFDQLRNEKMSSPSLLLSAGFLWIVPYVLPPRFRVSCHVICANFSRCRMQMIRITWLGRFYSMSHAWHLPRFRTGVIGQVGGASGIADI